MKIYWSDREGKPAPQGSTFHFYPFARGQNTSTTAQQTHLPPPTRAKILKKTFSPSRTEWIAAVEKALHLIQQGHLQKIVLARTCTLELDHAPDPFALAAALKEKAEGAFVFCLQTHNSAFLGASPERLFLRKGRKIFSEALAGTRRRGQTPEEDLLLGKDLLSNEKDLREIEPVQVYLQNVLSPFCENLPTLSPLILHKTQNVQHLYSQCIGTLKPNVKDAQIIAPLHPTPALCGTPKPIALQLIQELEPFQRGLYGGILGWSTENTSEWIVGIRSCLLEGNKATLFSGTGIVEGSNPAEEWDELNQKLRLYDGILDH